MILSPISNITVPKLFLHSKINLPSLKYNYSLSTYRWNNFIQHVNCCKVISEKFKTQFCLIVEVLVIPLTHHFEPITPVFLSLWHAPLLFTNPKWCLQFQHLILTTFLNPLMWEGIPLISAYLQLFFRIHTWTFSYANTLAKKFPPALTSVKHLYYFKV